MGKRLIILLIGRVLLFCIGCGVILAITSGVTKGLTLIYSNILSIALALIGTLLLTVVFVKWERLKLRDVWVVPGDKTTRRVLTGLLIGSLLAMLQPLLVITFGHVSMDRSSAIGYAAIASNLLLYLLIACREEIAFRGYPMSVLSRSVGGIGAQIIIAIVFIIEHKIGGMTWIQAVIGPGIGAIFFGLAALKTKGLALSTGLHTAWNFVQWFLGFKPEHGVYNITVEKGFENSSDLVGWGSYIFVMGLGILVIQLAFDNKQEKKQLKAS